MYQENLGCTSWCETQNDVLLCKACICSIQKKQSCHAIKAVSVSKSHPFLLVCILRHLERSIIICDIVVPTRLSALQQGPKASILFITCQQQSLNIRILIFAIVCIRCHLERSIIIFDTVVKPTRLSAPQSVVYIFLM